VLRTRHLALVLALILAFPAAAFAQGAGDDQYQDPFGDEPTAQNQTPPAEEDEELSDEPPGGGGESGGTEATPAPADPATPRQDDGDNLPYTGSDPRPLAIIAVAFILMGIGLRLRTIDPDAF
jgi:hypothetical protein